MSYGYASPSFAAAKKQGSRKPFEKRVEIAINRYKAALAKLGGSINVRSEGDMVDFGMKHVFNRGRELGDHRNGEFRKVIVAAVKQLLESACEFDRERMQMILKERFDRPREHHQKYNPQRGRSHYA